MSQMNPKAAITAAVRSRLFQRNLDPAIHAFSYEREIDPATEFVRNEIAYKIGAVAGLNLGRHRRTSKLAPGLPADRLAYGPN